MEITAQVKQVKSFELILNGEAVGLFSVASEWKGMIELVNTKGQIVIVSDDSSFIDNLFSGLFDDKESKKFTVVKISPDLVPT